MSQLAILDVTLLDKHRPLVSQFREVSARLGLGLGWHYLLDLSWAAAQLALQPGDKVLDAGAGIGVMQWWLADRGVDVISADRLDRRGLPLRFRRQYPVKGLRGEDLAPTWQVVTRGLMPPRPRGRWTAHLRQAAALLREWGRRREPAAGKGTIFVYHRDLTAMPEIPDHSLDAVVSISALEHNDPAGLRACVAELMRVLKPGGKLVATLGAAKDADWFHGPSKGWCYTEATLRSIFELPEDTVSNYVNYDELLKELVSCTELRDSLAPFYFKSGDNGMPWGRWNPQYQPVGVVKVKTHNNR